MDKKIVSLADYSNDSRHTNVSELLKFILASIESGELKAQKAVLTLESDAETLVFVAGASYIETIGILEISKLIMAQGSEE